MFNFFSKKIEILEGILDQAYDDDAGWDIRYFSIDGQPILIKSGERNILSTGVKLRIPKNMEGQIRSRSGLASKHGIMVLNSPGTIDSGYEGEIKVILYNTSKKDYSVNPGDKIAQIIFQVLPKISIGGRRSNKIRKDNGFGSSDINYF